jgi:hypothetical protein
MSITIRPRSAWGAAPPSSPLINMPVPTPWIYIHHSASEAFGPPALRSFQDFHMRPESQGGKDMRDIAYNFLIDRDTTIWEGRGAGKAHGGNTGADNSLSHSICLMGNYDVVGLPRDVEYTLIELLREGKRRGWWLLNDIRGHRQEVGAQTACPGRHVMARLPTIKNHANAQATTPTPTPIFEEDDSMFLYSAPGEPVFFCDGGMSVGINEASDMATFDQQKVKHFRLDADTFAKFRARYPGA